MHFSYILRELVIINAQSGCANPGDEALVRAPLYLGIVCMQGFSWFLAQTSLDAGAFIVR